MDREAWLDYSLWGHKESDMTEHIHTHIIAEYTFLKNKMFFFKSLQC